MGGEVLTAVLFLPNHAPARHAIASCLRKAKVWVSEATGEREAIRLAAARPDLILVEAEGGSSGASALETRLRSIASRASFVRISPDDPTSGAPGSAVLFGLASALAEVLAERRRAGDAAESLAAEAKIAALERDARAVEHFDAESDPRPAVEPARPLRSSQVDAFCDVVAEYEELLDLGVEQNDYRVEHDVSGRLKALAERLGRMQAGPRDVIEIHGTALKRKTLGLAARRARAYTEEGRLLVLELMGHLVAQYRRGHAPKARADGRASASREDNQR